MDWGFCQVWQLLLGVLNSPAGNKNGSFGSAGRGRCGHLDPVLEGMGRFWIGGDWSRKLQEQLQAGWFSGERGGMLVLVWKGLGLDALRL